MASRHIEDASTRSLQKQPSRSNTQSHSKSIISEPDYSSDEDQNVLKYWMKNKDVLEKRYGSYLVGKTNTKKRIPRYYTINNNCTILIILQGDITKTEVDAIVNAANEHMTGGGGVDGIIHRAAGNMLYKACVAHKEVKRGVRLPTGHSRILLSYNMSSTTYYIINTAGPMYDRTAVEECAQQLLSCYKTSLDLANLYDLESIGFTAISCGIFGYPVNDGADVALRTVDKNADSLPVVVFVLWDDHIYDAWVKKATELKFTPFDPESSILKNPTKHETDDKDEKYTTDQSKSSSTSNRKVIDLSTKDTTEDKTAELVNGLPSVPDEPSDSQQTQILDPDENSMEIEHNLHSQKTTEMSDANSQQEKEEEVTEEETKPVTDEESKQPTGEEKIGNNKKVHHDDDRPSAVTDTPQHHD